MNSLHEVTVESIYWIANYVAETARHTFQRLIREVRQGIYPNAYLK